MRPDFLQDAEEWLVRAEEDREVAEVILRHSRNLGIGVAFHAQQAVEKALKGFLMAFGQPFNRTHQLTPLLQACEAIDPSFQQFANVVDTLTPYAVEFRYPGGRAQPTEAEAEEALQAATIILQFVRARLVDEARPIDELR